MADNKEKAKDFGKYNTPIDLGYFDYSTQDPGARGPGGVYPHRGSAYPPVRTEVEPTPDAMRGDPRFTAPQPQSRGWFYDNFIKDNENLQMLRELPGDAKRGLESLAGGVKQGFKKLDEGLEKVNDWASNPETYENRGTVRKLPGLREAAENFKAGWNEYFGGAGNNEPQGPSVNESQHTETPNAMAGDPRFAAPVQE